MTDDFKRKLEAYKEGQLQEDEAREVERELERLEIVQMVLEEQLDETRNRRVVHSLSSLDERKQKRMIRRGKWKARYQNAATTIAIVFVIGLCMTIVTSAFYSWGEPDRSEVYRDVVASTIAVTEPNVTFQDRLIQQNFLFSMTLEGDLEKQVGGERQIPLGTLSVKFFFNQVSYPERKMVNELRERPLFYYPSSDVIDSDDAWYRLEQLPEGTVAEAYVSLDRLYATDELLQILKDIEMDPIWYAVDTGFDRPAAGEPMSPYDPIGFPHDVVWHHDDFTVTGHQEERWGWFGQSVSQSAESPAVEHYGSAELRNENFIQTLQLVADYEHMAERVSSNWDLKIHDRLDYVKEHGVNIYGVVVTGPTKELLKLKDETWVAGLKVGDVRLWNWPKPVGE